MAAHMAYYCILHRCQSVYASVVPESKFAQHKNQTYSVVFAPSMIQTIFGTVCTVREVNKFRGVHCVIWTP